MTDFFDTRGHSEPRLEQEWRMHLDPEDVFDRPWQWMLISRDEAVMRAPSSPVIVVFRSGPLEHATWFGKGTLFFWGVGPYNLRTLRYYRYVGELPPKRGLTAEGVSTRGGPETSTSEVPRLGLPKPGVTPEQTTTWIGIELVDDSGLAVAGECYRIELPDSSIKEGVLDADGKALVDGIDPGMCKVSFPDLDARAWRAA